MRLRLPRLGTKVRPAPAWGVRDALGLEAEARALDRAGAADLDPDVLARPSCSAASDRASGARNRVGGRVAQARGGLPALSEARRRRPGLPGFRPLVGAGDAAEPPVRADAGAPLPNPCRRGWPFWLPGGSSARSDRPRPGGAGST